MHSFGWNLKGLELLHFPLLYLTVTLPVHSRDSPLQKSLETKLRSVGRTATWAMPTSFWGGLMPLLTITSEWTSSFVPSSLGGCLYFRKEIIGGWIKQYILWILLIYIVPVSSIELYRVHKSSTPVLLPRYTFALVSILVTHCGQFGQIPYNQPCFGGENKRQTYINMYDLRLSHWNMWCSCAI